MSILLTVFLTHSFIINHFHTKKDPVTYLTKCVTGQNSVRGLKVCPGHGVRYHPRVRPFQPVTPLTVLQGAIAPCTFILTLGGGGGLATVAADTENVF